MFCVNTGIGLRCINSSCHQLGVMLPVRIICLLMEQILYTSWNVGEIFEEAAALEVHFLTFIYTFYRTSS